ncbi:hypothetical protein GDO81_029921 [Engystomops pustulosus]|uniref:Iodothyronine deiodinase n=1 Tax=Engystomops pustulosus TaxID=76066 RepID=A0AAV6ZLD9_ENGPU|nr:hypothetical protein GDO81_029921 [Engystomops pustulosus]
MEMSVRLIRRAGRCVHKSLIFCSLFLYVVVGKTLMLLAPHTMETLLKSRFEMTGAHVPKFQYEDWGPTVFTFKFLWSVLQIMWLRLEDEAFLGKTAPNTPVVDLNGELHHIWDYLRDGWALKNNISIKKHQNIQDRLSAAKRLMEELPSCPVVVDTMQNLCSAKYAALPERLYILQEGKVIYKGNMGPWGYKPEEVRGVLEKTK